ncbi:hypothetical protein GCM10025771_39850 [Niveibacterium umoris]|uniref:Uncharacterized protein n=1 Tax=Niveibacterium umoris TaxID=1193620 RepID=A0A840BDN8_9RHOO|nr:hypothetical protein [Niveibacterium umoris]MBB4010813.1 hypothetical protein [Niveibacterium umoris]
MNTPQILSAGARVRILRSPPLTSPLGAQAQRLGTLVRPNRFGGWYVAVDRHGKAPLLALAWPHEIEPL